jgi:hypothetical protein
VADVDAFGHPQFRTLDGDVLEDPEEDDDNCSWKMAKLNHDYEICTTLYVMEFTDSGMGGGQM